MADSQFLTAILQEEDVHLDFPVETKNELLAAAAEHLGRTTSMPISTLLAALEDREKLGSTAIEHGIAVPHALIDSLAAPAVAFFRLTKPIEFEAADHAPVDLVFVLVWPSGARGELLSALGSLCRSLRVETVRQQIRKASSGAEVRRVLDEAAAQGTSGRSGS